MIWCHWGLFGPHRIARLILVDEPPVLVANPGWSPEERWTAGGIMDPNDLYRFADRLAGPDGEAATREILFSMVTSAMSKAQKEELLAVNLQFPRPLAARLILNNAIQDWRDTIPRIDLPTLIVFGMASPHPVQCQQWIRDQIDGSRLEIFEAEEGGSHFLFLEAPERFQCRRGGAYRSGTETTYPVRHSPTEPRSDDRMHIQDGEARSILRDKGFTVDESEERVRIGEGHFALTAVGGPPFVSDLDGGRRAGTFADQLNFLKLVAMSDLMQIMGGACVEAQDLPADTRYLDYYLACCTLSDKAWKPLTIGRHRAARRHRNGQDLAWRERRATGGRSGILYTQHQHQHAAGAGCRDRPGRHRIHPSRPARSRSRPLRSLAPCRRQRSPVH